MIDVIMLLATLPSICQQVYISLLNSFVKFHAKKSARIAEISAKVTGGYFFMFTLYIFSRMVIMCLVGC